MPPPRFLPPLRFRIRLVFFLSLGALITHLTSLLVTHNFPSLTQHLNLPPFLQSHFVFPLVGFGSTWGRASEKIFVPGRLGRDLVQKHMEYVKRELDSGHFHENEWENAPQARIPPDNQSSPDSFWQTYLKKTGTQSIANLFPLPDHASDEAKREIGWVDLGQVPLGFDVGGEGDQDQARWRLRMLKEVSTWKVHESFSTWPDQKAKNAQNLAHLIHCLHHHLPNEPRIPHPKASTLERGKGLGCSLRTTRVVVGSWWFFTLGFTKAGLSGEAVWLSSMIDALEEQGYTVLASSSYEGMIDAHAGMPNLISHILTEEKQLLSCLSDPLCLHPSDFHPTLQDFPRIRLHTNGTPWITPLMTGWQEDHPPQKWVWSEGEVEELMEREERGEVRRGTIPRWKLFCLTWWGTKPNQGYWPTPLDFSWNPLGPQWTLSPFAYPDHSFMPYSIERECTQIRLTPPHRKQDRVFILAKLAEYFYQRDTAPNATVFADFKEQTGLGLVSVAKDRKTKDGWVGAGVPEGVEEWDQLSREDFEFAIGQSKVMLGIGRPYISPSVYTALCQGTPVVLPYFKKEGLPEGYDLFDGEYAQHGPAAMIGAPYVYSYYREDLDQMRDAVMQAAQSPIKRYIPDEMKWNSVKQDVEDFMRFDWKRHAELVARVDGEMPLQSRLPVIGRCYNIGRCRPMDIPA